LDANNAIGFAGKLPWHIPEDLAWFRKHTLGHPVIMGRRTFQSLPAPLPDRTNIVLTSNHEFAAAGIKVYHSVLEVLAAIGDDTAFVIGGQQVFQEFLPLAEEMLLTRIHAEFKADTYFPAFDETAWDLVLRTDLTSKQGLALSFLRYVRKPGESI